MKSLIFIIVALIMFFGTLLFVWKVVSESNSCLEIGCPVESKYFVSGDSYYSCECPEVENPEPICFETELEAIDAGYKKGDC